MKIRNEIIRLLEQVKRMPVPVSETSNLYTDLALDSLSFIHFLLKIEKIYSISFGIMEMEQCIEASGLIALVESKTGGGGALD